MHNANFRVTFHDPDPPDIEFITGNLTWVVLVQNLNESSPGDIASITIDPATSSDNFVITIADGSEPGAANVGVIDLTASSWSGYSALGEASNIAGDLTGSLVLASASSTGGELILTVGGDVSGDITVPTVSFLEVAGDLSGEITVTDTVNGTLKVDHAVAETAVVTIADLADGAHLDFTDASSATETFAGQLILESGVPYNTVVLVRRPMETSAAIDLQGEDVVGNLILAGGAGQVLVGAVALGGELDLAQNQTFSGIAEIGSVSGAVRAAEHGILDGEVIILGDVAGTFAVDGEMTSNASIVIGGDLLDHLAIERQNDQSGEMAGLIDIGGALDGVISIGNGALLGTIHVGGDQSGLIFLDGSNVDAGGAIHINGTLSGGILLTSGNLADGDMDGEIHIGGDVSAHDERQSILIQGVMHDGARIKIDGSLNANESLKEDEIEIQGGLDSHAAITVDYDGWDAEDIWEEGATILIDAEVYTENTPAAHVWEVQFCRGDLDNDGNITNFDINAYVAALLMTDEDENNVPDYIDEFPGLEGSRVYHGDCNCSAAFNNFDTDPFVDLLLAGCCTTDCTPCESFAAGQSGESGSAAAALAARLRDNVATGRVDDLLQIVADLAGDSEGQRPEFWADVWSALQS